LRRLPSQPGGVVGFPWLGQLKKASESSMEG